MRQRENNDRDITGTKNAINTHAHTHKHTHTHTHIFLNALILSVSVSEITFPSFQIATPQMIMHVLISIAE